LRTFAAKNIAPHERVLIAPFTPMLYPILRHESPLWDLAYYFPATAQRQEAMIHELAAKNVNWAIISDTPPDKREDLRFSATHKLVWQYLTEDFEPVESACLPKSVKILHRKRPGSTPD
jgi:tryptophan synthase alpha subunit